MKKKEPLTILNLHDFTISSLPSTFMKWIPSFICLITLFFCFSSCKDKYELDGKWDDNIKLSAKNVEFDSGIDSVTVKTGGNFWWITDVTVNGTIFHLPENINIESNAYSFSKDCFVVERKDKNTLFVKVLENQSSAKRVINIGLEAGDYFDNLTITQASK
jgi:hypothetical protein